MVQRKGGDKRTEMSGVEDNEEYRTKNRTLRTSQEEVCKEENSF